jgi:hypothetical protein
MTIRKSRTTIFRFLDALQERDVDSRKSKRRDRSRAARKAGYPLSAISCQLSDISYPLSDISYPLRASIKLEPKRKLKGYKRKREPTGKDRKLKLKAKS